LVHVVGQLQRGKRRGVIKKKGKGKGRRGRSKKFPLCLWINQTYRGEVVNKGKKKKGEKKEEGRGNELVDG